MPSFVTVLFNFLILGGATLGQVCKCTPPDSCWPSEAQWDSFNDTISGRLIRIVPPASACYPTEPNYNEESCNSILSNWTAWEFHSADSASTASVKSCQPIYPNGTGINGDPDAGKKGCSLGSLPPYVVNATEPSDIQQTLAFAKENNIRINIKNTGHSGSTRSTAFGSISIWTHNLKKTVFHEKFQPSSCTLNSTWKGSQMAITVGAGVQDGELYKFAEKNNVVAVGGTSMDVGVVGWATGGGHGFMTGQFGMGADNILEAIIVTPGRALLTANECQNEDIYWAIRGGGGSTFGVIVDMTMKAYPIPDFTLINLSLVAKNGTLAKDWWQVVAKFHALLPALQDQGLQGYYTINGPPSSETISLTGALFLWNSSNGTASNITAPIRQLVSDNAAAVTGSAELVPVPPFYGFLDSATIPDHAGGNGITASRLVSRKVVTEDEDLFAKVLMEVGPKQVAPTDGSTNPSMSGTLTIGLEPVDNALNPAWRQTAVHMITSTSWSDSLPQENVSRIVNDMTYNKLDALRRLAPDMGAYLNEANTFEPGWQWSFFGPNYARLRTIKEKYDPEGLLWCPQCVGSEDWAQIEDGKLCRTYNVFAPPQL